jgi:acyl dehydratase
VPENLLGLLKILLLVLLYLFFARVLWAVWSEVRGTGAASRNEPAGRRRGRRGRTSLPPPAARVVIVQPEPRRGTAFELDHELTVGRSGGCQIAVPDDTFASQLHARLYRAGDDAFVEDLGSTNGTYVNGQRVTAPTPVRRGDSLQVGTTVLEVQ